jgi:flagellin-like hook-associated protein FlgL
MPDLNKVNQRLQDATALFRSVDTRNAARPRPQTRQARTQTPPPSQDRPDLSSGPPSFSRAAERTRQAQDRMGQANRTEGSLRGQAGRLRRLRDIAQQGTDRQLSAESRRSLTARFEALLNRIDDAASAADAPEPAADPAPPTTSAAAPVEIDNPAPNETPVAPTPEAQTQPPQPPIAAAPETVPEETANPAAATAPASAPEETADPAPNETATTPVADAPPGIGITGETRVRGARIREEGTGLAESTVARDRGLANVQVAETEDQVRFTFQDLGEGRIQATRFERTEQGMVATGTQTVAAPDVLEGRVAEGQTEALNFDRLGLQIELDGNYTAGDLQGLEITSAPATAESGAAATEPSSQQLTVDDPEAAQAAYNRIDQVLADMARVRDDLRQRREAESADALRALADYGNQEDISTLTDAETAGALAETLRTQILEQAAGAVTAQGEVNTDRLLLLLG